jgi:hypothetical protein
LLTDAIALRQELHVTLQHITICLVPCVWLLGCLACLFLVFKLVEWVVSDALQLVWVWLVTFVSILEVLAEV